VVIVAIVQARFASSRLPGKAMLKIGKLPSLAHVLIRTLRISGVTHFLLATTTHSDDDKLKELAENLGFEVYRGDTDDVVSRFYSAAQIHSADYVVRITGDCPILDPTLAGELVTRALEERADLTLNYDPPTFPDGLDVSVISKEALRVLAHEDLSSHDREHVTTAIERGDLKVRTVRVTSNTDLSHHRWTLDNAKDLEFFNQLSAHSKRPLVQMTTEEILSVVQNNPDIRAINSNYGRNYGHAD